MTVTLTEDRFAINIDLIDDNGTSGSGHLYRVPDARLQSGSWALSREMERDQRLHISTHDLH